MQHFVKDMFAQYGYGTWGVSEQFGIALRDLTSINIHFIRGLYFYTTSQQTTKVQI